MTAAQLSLDIDTPRRRTAQVIDPRTGLPVAFLRKAQAIVLEAIVALDSANAYAAQEWLRSHGKRVPDTNAFGSRCDEMESVGWVVYVDDRASLATNRSQKVYAATDAGRERLAAWLDARGES